GLQPEDRARSKKSESLTPRAAAQMTRTDACQPKRPIIKKAMTTETSGGTSRGSRQRTTRRRNSEGKARERSVADRTMRSNQPPRRPAALPNKAAIKVDR